MVYATPQSVADSAVLVVLLVQLSPIGAHRNNANNKEIIAHIQSKNDRVRVIGMTATPYRIG